MQNGFPITTNFTKRERKRERGGGRRNDTPPEDGEGWGNNGPYRISPLTTSFDFAIIQMFQCKECLLTKVYVRIHLY